MSQDYYKVLDVDKKASKAEIKKAFRAKAKQHHPDKGGDEATFKKLNEAYEVLADDQKRSHYDQFGSAGPQSRGGGGGGGGFDFNGMGGDFGGFEDVFSSFFGGGRGGGSSRRSSKSRGADLEVEVELSFEESVLGTTKIFSSRNYQACESCDSKGGEGKKTCSACQGTGAVAQRFQTPFGTVAQKGVCPTCSGEGSSFEEVCSSCKGEGRCEEKIKIEVEVPSGIQNGETLQLSGKGEAGRRGGRHGDLFVHIRVAASRKFKRQGLDLLTPLKISVFDAILGGKQDVETFWGKGSIPVPALTREGDILRLAGKGIKRGGSTGDHLVQIEYILPKKITPELQELLEKAKNV